MSKTKMEKTKVVVAMSGGVDSSVAAALLVKQGYDVTGMMLKLWSEENCDQKENACCTPESISQASDVAGKLGIPFYVLDAKQEFKRKVVDPFIDLYEEGLTPNPCFVCNQTIKWGYLLKMALDAGADYLATGHYARIQSNQDLIYQVRKAADPAKDQSYVLAGLTQHQLSHTLLPLGELSKIEVRKIAENYGFTVASKPDSQDLCFVGKNGYREFINQLGHGLQKPGIIMDIQGNSVGTHSGLANYTIGQRKGLGSGFSQPIYVIEKRNDENILVIGTEEQLGSTTIHAQLINWVNLDIFENSLNYQVKIRYRSKTVPCTIKLFDRTKIAIHLEYPVRDATPGQIAVIYNQEMVVGCGNIYKTERN